MSRRTRLASIALIVVLTAVATASAWYWRHEVDRASSQDRVRVAMESAARAARAAVPVFGDVSAATAAADEVRSRTVLTPEFASSYEPLLAQSATSARQHGAVILEAVQDAQPITISADHATVKVLVFFVEHATFADHRPPADRSLQYVITMRRVGAKWLVDGADPAS